MITIITLPLCIAVALLVTARNAKDLGITDVVFKGAMEVLGRAAIMVALFEAMKLSEHGQWFALIFLYMVSYAANIITTNQVPANLTVSKITWYTSMALSIGIMLLIGSWAVLVLLIPLGLFVLKAANQKELIFDYIEVAATAALILCTAFYAYMG